MIGAARLGGSDVGPDQAKPGRSDGPRYPVALICCRGLASFVRGPRSATGEARRAWSGLDWHSAAVGQSVNAPDHPGERRKSRSRRRSRAPAPATGHSNHRRAMLRRCSLFDIPGRSWRPGASVRPVLVVRQAHHEVLSSGEPLSSPLVSLSNHEAVALTPRVTRHPRPC